ncbi:UNVERIFIED_CONTAM: Retrovirus-related Pol polyprotein from transposon TNT 1-94 [Sesamum radiatum]|uniref:Retrovirus-related Pol polyprotein from transposon TNT 1-94 n=1 Tax=Sesamum radiatum TaxID=300843 RepID=A0AAW2Q1H7_SESRA
MLSLVEKLEDLKAGLNNDTYIDVILQSLPPSYDPFIINYNMNGLEQSIHELINMLVQYEATTRKSEPSVLVGEALTSKAKGKGARRWKRKKGKGKGKVRGSQQSRTNDVCIHCHGKGHWKRECPQLLSHPGMFVVGINMISNSASWVLDTGCGAYICNDLQSNLIMTAQHKRKVDNHENAQIWHARLGHISKDRKEVGYVYLMRYKFEAFGRLKEYRLEVENQTSRKIKALRSDRGGEYLSGEFIDYLKENGILSEWTPPGTPQLNGVAERRNRTLLDMVRSMMSFTELPPSFWGHALETAVKLLNISPSKSIPQTPYEIWHDKPTSYKYLRVWGNPAYVKRLVGDKLDSRSSLCRLLDIRKKLRDTIFMIQPSKRFLSWNAVFLEKGFPSDNQRDEVLIEESSGESPHNSTTSFEPTVHTDGVPILCRSTREPRVPERYGFVGLTSQLDNDPKTYGEAMSDIDSDKWLEAMKSEMDLMGSNQARLVAKGYTQRPGVDFEETYSPVAMAKSHSNTACHSSMEGFTTVGKEQKVCRLQRSIYGLKQASRSWNTRFDEVIRGYDFIKNDYDPCVYKKISGSSVAYVVLYVDDILLIGNDVKMLGDIKSMVVHSVLHEGHG